MTWHKWEKLFSCMINQRLLVQDIALVVCMNKYLYIYIHDIYLKRFIDTMYVKVCVLLCLCLSGAGACVCLCVSVYVLFPSLYIYIFYSSEFYYIMFIYIYLFVHGDSVLIGSKITTNDACFPLWTLTHFHRLTRRACGYNLGGFGSPWPSPRETCEATPTAYAVYPPAGYSLFPKREQKARIEKKNVMPYTACR